MPDGNSSTRREFRVLSTADRMVYVFLFTLLAIFTVWQVINGTTAFEKPTRYALVAAFALIFGCMPIAAFLFIPYRLVLDKARVSLLPMLVAGRYSTVELAAVRLIIVHYRGRRVELLGSGANLTIPFGQYANTGEVLRFLEELSVTPVGMRFEHDINQFLTCRRLAIRAEEVAPSTGALRAARRAAAQGRVNTASVMYWLVGAGSGISAADEPVVELVRWLSDPMRRVRV
ncbi:hypothetical protein FDZ71_00805 [bacterium]|nr:MAG: hypothetical protein FDZ71_00805 [bacterium]